jgi:transcriptional regulator with XRE-family HTH domain
MNFNKFARDARAKLGFTQVKFARKLGVSKASIIRYQRDGYPMPEPVRLAILRLLDQHKTKSAK